ncbi:MAG: pimelyl-ACP methyl ester esterase BioV [Campylobacterota bacterium]|nr:pimelyl-ACP methyl ester esterase BioV [Campylobacterota bacterium]
MTFYSGFSLREDAAFFESYLKNSEYCVSGFSYGAIKALLHVSQSKTRIDTLQLFSPAFFQSKPEKFKRLQMMGYKRNSKAYLQGFMQSCFAPHECRETLHVKSNADELQELLYFEWPVDMLKEIVSRGIKIEVYLGEKDAVIDADATKAFFLAFATTYYIKNANHFLLQE